MNKIQKIDEIKKISKFIKKEKEKQPFNNEKNTFDEILQKEVEKLKIKKSEN